MTVMEKYAWLKDQIKDDEFQKLMTWVETETDYLKSPASYKYHASHEQGLLEHSVSVAMAAIRIKRSLAADDITDEDCIIVGLLHDLGKAGDQGKPLYIENQPTERQKQYGYKASIPYSVSEDVIYMEHEVRSIYLVNSCPVSNFKLTDVMVAAITMHDDPWQGQKSAYRKNKLMTILQMANYYSLLYLED